MSDPQTTVEPLSKRCTMPKPGRRRAVWVTDPKYLEPPPRPDWSYPDKATLELVRRTREEMARTAEDATRLHAAEIVTRPHDETSFPNPM